MLVGAGPDGRLLLITGDDGTRLWDSSARRWTGPALPIDSAVDFGADGRSYAVSDALAVLTAAEWWGAKSARVRWQEFCLASVGWAVPTELAEVVARVASRLQPALEQLGPFASDRRSFSQA